MERDDRMTDAAATPPDSGGAFRGDCFQLWKDDAAAMLDLPEAERHAVTDAVLEWFTGGELRKQSTIVLDWFLSQLVRKQETAARKYARIRKAQADGGRDAMRRRWHGADKSLISCGKSLINENETKLKPNENETRNDAPPPSPFSNSNPAPTVDDLFSDSPSTAAIDAIIKKVADVMGDDRPSVHKWRKFIEERGARAFYDIAHSFCNDIRNGKQVDNMGAYFNALLDSH